MFRINRDFCSLRFFGCVDGKTEALDVGTRSGL